MTRTGTQTIPHEARNMASPSVLKRARELERVSRRQAPSIPIPISVTSHHVRLTAAVIEQLFCNLYRLHASGPVLQDGGYTTMETVTLIGPKGRLRKIPVVGPASTTNQIQISRTDALLLGIKVPVRESGDLTGTPGLILEGPRSHVVLGTGVIRACRHVRMSPADADRLGLKDRDRVEVSTQSANRSLSFRNVLVRAAPGYNLELVLDTDEANAAGLRTGDYAELAYRAGKDCP
jgi:propanediol utilization protein